ncbi:sensor histidine kinase [Raineyella fluvialis]|uniref:histidine kinase n=1 Tax=Raineyella fluvialis TaxID=2662261 RepID=A0A5Q2FF00_9ACTN|nr:ATP-binding protein [Raineyella fluvialis]QGF22866.1 hypothetical protein Rai3103_03355 [Raineyella fluvialis]
MGDDKGRWWLRVATLGTDGHDPRDDAELALGVIFVVLGAGVVTQALIAMPAGLPLAAARAWYLALTMTLSGVVVGGCIGTLRRGTVPAAPWGWASLVLSLAAMPAFTHIMPGSELLGSWTVSVFGFAQLSVAAAGVWMHSVPRTFLLSVAVGGYYYWLLIAAGGPYGQVSVVANALNYPVFALAISLVSQYWRILAQRTHDAHQEALLATRQMELDRYRMTVHDTSGILRLLGDEATPDEVLPAVRRQALAEANRLRHYLASPTGGAGRVGEADSGRVRLGDVLGEAVDGFADLPLELSTALGADALLVASDAVAVAQAVETLLHNVRRHARASTVWVHADTTGDRWEVVVRDDGVGFTADPATYGFGLRTQVLAALTKRGIAVEIDSAPGEGCAVTLSGPVAVPDAREHR